MTDHANAYLIVGRGDVSPNLGQELAIYQHLIFRKQMARASEPVEATEQARMRDFEFQKSFPKRQIDLFFVISVQAVSERAAHVLSRRLQSN